MRNQTNGPPTNLEYVLLQWLRWLAVALLLVLLLAACERKPQLVTGLGPGGADVSGSTAKVFFVTDRGAQTEGRKGLAYGHRRSQSMAFGEAIVRFGSDGAVAGTSRRIPINVVRVDEQLRFPQTPLPFSQRRGVVVPDKGARAVYGAAADEFKARVAQELKRTGQSEIVVFVHGFRNDFNDAVATLSNIWHASDRMAMPIAYTWPADNPGLLGYFRDRESGEFSVFHLKETLRLLAEVEGLDSLHLIAHSRGTDVATTALREMIIEARASGRNPRDVLKIDNLILAAPDLDFGVVRQRLIAERFGPAFECITVYMNPEDGALGTAQAVLSGTRFGRLSFEDLSEVDREIFRQIGNVYFIDVSQVATRTSHSYFSRNPDVMTDIVALLKTSAAPGSPERRMTHLEANFWQLELEENFRVVRPDR
ncbi:hypothetical protein PEL8287_01949 [Roseovarius litorisediminis]|uniref:Alpha/beta hydrolase family protein n=1 Tax=Roseovarius litorisediminis TaxID=1312363 RepID=A0A1Y5SGK7_9RHOB|nr:alpha/beta hydrolase [Roseovarius litorisediminis]SLN39652.1 hypothetical protein PEL8287_01949 [Roseovarius litorisediminis]